MTLEADPSTTDGADAAYAAGLDVPDEDRRPVLPHDHRWGKWLERDGRGQGWTRGCTREGCGALERRAHDEMGPTDFGTAGKRVYDWPRIKKMYVEGIKDREGDGHTWPTLEQVAIELGLVPQRVRERSAAEGWRDERKQWQADLERIRRVNRANALSQEAMRLDSAALDVARTGLELCQAKVDAIGKAVARAREAGGGLLDGTELVDALEQQRLASAVDMWHKVGLRAAGDPEVHRLEVTGANGARIEIAQELRRDDPSRITGVLGVLHAAGLGDLFGGPEAAGRTLEAHRRADGVHEALPPGD